MRTAIAKEFRWEMSHRLPFHEGLCKNLHGHTYMMRVEIEGDPDRNGIVMDYYDIEKIVGPFVAKLDHSFVCSEDDDLMINFLKENGFRMYVVPDNTTAENLARYALEILAPAFAKFGNLYKLKILFYETRDAYAAVETDLNS